MFRDNIYEQTRGVPIGSRIKGVLAEITIRSIEVEKVYKFQPSLKFYVRYIDDVLTMWSNEKNIQDFAEEFSIEAYRLVLKLEQKNECAINYLDIKLVAEEGNLITSV